MWSAITQRNHAAGVKYDSAVRSQQGRGPGLSLTGTLNGPRTGQVCLMECGWQEGGNRDVEPSLVGACSQQAHVGAGLCQLNFPTYASQCQGPTWLVWTVIAGPSGSERHGDATVGCQSAQNGKASEMGLYLSGAGSVYYRAGQVRDQ